MVVVVGTEEGGWETEPECTSKSTLVGPVFGGLPNGRRGRLPVTATASAGGSGRRAELGSKPPPPSPFSRPEPAHIEAAGGAATPGGDADLDGATGTESAAGFGDGIGNELARKVAEQGMSPPSWAPAPTELATLGDTGIRDGYFGEVSLGAIDALIASAEAESADPSTGPSGSGMLGGEEFTGNVRGDDACAVGHGCTYDVPGPPPIRDEDLLMHMTISTIFVVVEPPDDSAQALTFGGGGGDTCGGASGAGGGGDSADAEGVPAASVCTRPQHESSPISEEFHALFPTGLSCRPTPSANASSDQPSPPQSGELSLYSNVLQRVQEDAVAPRVMPSPVLVPPTDDSTVGARGGSAGDAAASATAGSFASWFPPAVTPSSLAGWVSKATKAIRRTLSMACCMGDDAQ